MADKIIIFSGKQYSGKDTAAKIMLEGLIGYRRCAIADIIKIEYAKEKGLTLEEIETNKAQYRPDLIELGNKGRQIAPDYWIKKVIEQEGNIIVTDVRLPYEYNRFKSAGAVTIRIEASRETRAQRGTLVKEDDITETALDSVTDWNYVVPNDQDYNTLRARILNIAKQIRRGKIKRKKVYKNCTVTYNPVTRKPVPRESMSAIKATLRDTVIGFAGIFVISIPTIPILIQPDRSYLFPELFSFLMIFVVGVTSYLIVTFCIRMIFKNKEKDLDISYDTSTELIYINGEKHDIKDLTQYSINISDVLNVFTLENGKKLKLYETEGSEKNTFGISKNLMNSNLEDCVVSILATYILTYMLPIAVIIIFFQMKIMGI